MNKRGASIGSSKSKRFDPNLGSYHHFYCLSCGNLTDFYSETLDQIKIPNEIEQRFNIISKRLVLNGYCETCKK